MSIWLQLVLLAVMMTCPQVPIKKRHMHRFTMLPLPAWFHSAAAECLHNRVNSPASTRHIGGMTFQCKFIVVLVFFFFTYNIICEQLINILFIFRFTNIEAVWVITSAFKSLMKILLFQQSQVSRYPNWRPYIDAWFWRFEVGVNF